MNYPSPRTFTANTPANNAQDVPLSQEDELVRQVLAGDPPALEQLVREQFPRVYSVAYAHLGDREAAEDLAQEVFLRAHIHLPKLKEPGLLFHWLVRVTRNLALNWRRDGQRASKLVQMVPLDEATVKVPADPGESPREHLDRVRQNATVREAVQRLPPDLREVVLLHYAEGLNKSEIGRILGVHDSTIGRQLQRAHELLRKEVDALLAESLEPLRSDSRAAGRTTALVLAFVMLSPAAKAAVAASAGASALAASAGSTGTLPFALVQLVHGGAGAVKAKVAAAAAGVLVVGAALTYTAGDSRRAAPPPASVKPAQVSLPAAADRRAAVPAAEAPISLSPGDQDHSPERVQEGQYETTATLRGVVFDDLNTSVAGATVRAVAILDDGETISRTVITQERADFVLSQLPPGEITLFASAHGYTPVVQVVTAPAEAVILRLSRGGQHLTGTVIEAESKSAIRDVLVTLKPRSAYGKARASHEPRSLRTGALGEFEFENLTSGSYVLDASMPGRKLLIAGNQKEFKLKLANEETTDVELQMHAGYTLTGMVVDVGTSKPLGSATLWLGVDHPARKLMQTSSDAKGNYRFPPLFPEAGMKLYCALPGYRVEKTKAHQRPYYDLQFPDEALALSQGVRMERAVTVSGTVRTLDGNPLGGARVMNTEDAWRMKENAPFSLSDAEGKFTIETNPFQSITVRAEASGYPAQESGVVSVKDVPVEGVKIQLGPVGTIFGKVMDESGNVISGAEVKAHRELRVGTGGTQYKYESVISDDAGAYVITGLATITESLNKCTISVNARKPGFAPGKMEHVELSPQAIQNQVNLTVGKPHVLAGRVVTSERNPIEGATLQIYNGGDRSRQVTDENGMFRFDGLQEKPGSLHIEHDKHGSKQFDDVVAGREDVEYILDSAGTLMIGRVVDWKTLQPVSNFKVEETWGSGNVNSTGPPGEFRAKFGKNSLHLTISAPGYATVRASVPTPADGINVVEKTFRLGPAAKVRGRVLSHGSKSPVGGVRVRVNLDPLNASVHVKPAAQTTTAADGRFELSRLQSGANLLIFEPEPPLGPVKRQIYTNFGADQDIGDVLVGGLASLKGTVVRGSGFTPVPDQRIQLNGYTSWNGVEAPQKATSDAAGNFQFEQVPPGKYYVGLLRGDVGPSAATIVTLEDGDAKSIILRLGSSTLRGSAVQGGKPMRGHVDLTRGPRGAYTESFYATMDEGKFEMTDIPPGVWTLTVGSQAKPLLTENIEMAEGQVLERHFVIPQSRIVGEVIDGSGIPVAAATVSVAVPSFSRDPALHPGRSVVTTASGSDGRFVLEDAGMQPGTYTVTATKAGAGSAVMPNVIVSEADSAPVQLKLAQKGGTLVSLALNMTTGAPLSSAWLRISGPDGQFPVPHSRDDNGIARVEGMPPGKYAVSVGAIGFSGSERQVEIREGETLQIQDVLYEAGSLRWVILDAGGEPLKNVECRLVPMNADSIESPRDGKTDSDGQFLVTGLAPGTYAATAQARNIPPLTATFHVHAHDVAERVDRIN